MANQFLKNMESIGVRKEASVANLIDIGGHLGLGLSAANMDSATPLVLPSLSAFVIATPVMYNNNPHMKAVIKNMMECHSKSITGVSPNYTGEVSDTPIGFDSQTLQYPTQVKRAPVSPSITYQELRGNIIWNIHRTWMTDTRDPDTGYSFIGMEDDLPFASSTYTVSMLFIQNDITGRPDQMIDSWIVTNMWPTETGDLGSEKTTGEAKGMERSISYTGLLHHTDKTREIGYKVSQAMNIHKVKYMRMQKAPYGYDGIDKTLTDLGIQRDIKEFTG